MGTYQTGLGGISMELAGGKYYPITTDRVHHEIHEGCSFTASVADTSMADTDVISLAFKTGASTKIVHMTINASTKAGGHVELLESAAWTQGSGDLTGVIYNRDRIGTPTSSTLLENETAAEFAANDALVTNATITGGSPVAIMTRYTFGTNVKVGASADTRDEFMLKPDTNYAIRYTADGATNAGQIVLSWYEEGPIT